MSAESRSNAAPWPVAPRPFYEEAFGSWLGRVATRYQISVGTLWELSVSEDMPVLGTAGWILFPTISRSALGRFATLARLDDGRLSHIQTPPAWLADRRCMPYCFRCLVLNDADVSAPRWKREWLDPTAEFCSVHHSPLETVPASVFRLSNHFDAALRAISRYREKCLFRTTGRLR
ncbi:TniQ family protein [Paraburkholderia kirstenboschensis]|uniref:TniQ family protein n=1 Tax=Paraburkholderia kirstenboschensis TaxID=1245436 RepID=A0ABZ0ED52_9BURK|nr:TniQ family protein [Paraburkholderia kirstenboschensis]WOD14162.1 TniQ family protein [Paraburkholderia kirstenboschensis]